MGKLHELGPILVRAGMFDYLSSVGGFGRSDHLGIFGASPTGSKGDVIKSDMPRTWSEGPKCIRPGTIGN